MHLAQWTLASQRLDLAGARSPEDATRAGRRAGRRRSPTHPVIGWGHRSGGWDRDVTVSELDAVSGDTPVVLISGDGHHAWLNTTALHAPGDAGARLGGPRGRVVRGVRPARPRWSATTAPRRRPTAAPSTQRRPMGVVGHRRLRVQRRRRELGRALGRAAATCCGSGWRRTPTPSTTSSPPGCAPATRCPAATTALTMGPLKIISDGSLNTRTAWCCEPYADAHRLEYPAGQPNLSGDELRDLLARAHAQRPRGRHPRDRRRGGRRGAGGVRRDRRPRLDRARAAGRPRRRAPDGRARHPRPASSPPTCSTTATSPRRSGRRPVRALLRVPLDARRRRRAGAGLGRPGLAARPVAGDRGRGAPQRRRPRALARRAGAHRRARRWPPRSTASRRSASGRRGDLVLLDRRPAAQASTPRRPARPRPSGRAAHDAGRATSIAGEVGPRL